MSGCLVPSLPFPCSSTVARSLSYSTPSNILLPITNRSYLRPPRFSRHIRATSAAGSSAMETPSAAEHSGATDNQSGSTPLMKLLFVEMGVGYDQHGLVIPFSDFSPFSRQKYRNLIINWVKQPRYYGGCNARV